MLQTSMQNKDTQLKLYLTLVFNCIEGCGDRWECINLSPKRGKKVNRKTTLPEVFFICYHKEL